MAKNDNRDTTFDPLLTAIKQLEESLTARKEHEEMGRKIEERISEAADAAIAAGLSAKKLAEFGVRQRRTSRSRTTNTDSSGGHSADRPEHGDDQ